MNSYSLYIWCALRYSFQAACSSYECSAKELRCNLNVGSSPQRKQPYSDYTFCSRSSSYFSYGHGSSSDACYLESKCTGFVGSQESDVYRVTSSSVAHASGKWRWSETVCGNLVLSKDEQRHGTRQVPYRRPALPAVGQDGSYHAQRTRTLIPHSEHRCTLTPNALLHAVCAAGRRCY